MKALVARFVVYSSLCLPWLSSWAFPLTNEFRLVAGWNAIWLEAEPQNADGSLAAPAAVFTNAAVTIVATYFPEEGPMEFYENQTEDSLGREGWAVWRRDNKVVRKALTAISGMRAYLVKADQAVTVRVAGNPSFHVYRWIPDSYNLVGFGVLDDAPTFQQFFGPAGDALATTNMYELQGGSNWVLVNSSAQMRPGAAYWVYARGRPTYQGPFLVDIRGVGGLDYSTDTRDQELLFFNGTLGPISIRLERMLTPSGLELTEVIRNPARQIIASGPAIVDFHSSSVPGLGNLVLTLRLDRTNASSWSTPTNAQLYRVSSEQTKTYCWLPVQAVRRDLLPAVVQQVPVAESHGLWVGEVSIQSVSRNSTNNTTTPYPEPVTGSSKCRILLHVNGVGEVRLLKEVTLMRTRNVEGQTNQTVLVVNPEKLAFLEGIEKRGGRLVGRRIETTFYDLPRAGVAQADQVYQKLLPLQGGVGPGNSCSGLLTLDIHHRANPFRHPYHDSFRNGIKPITRDWKLTFDPPSTELLAEFPDYGSKLLTGTFQETVSGLVRTNIVVNGHFLIRRLNDCPTLQ